MRSRRLIETDAFPFEFLSRLAERESWRKEVHRPVYHVHKWWAKRLGTVFRGILLGCASSENEDLQDAFYRCHDFSGITVLDPFMGSGTTIGEAHKLGFTALGRDINPVAVRSVRVSLGSMDRRKIRQAFSDLSEEVGAAIRSLYSSEDSRERACDVLYYFWVMQTACPSCQHVVDLFPSYVFARNARPNKKPAVQILCPSCGVVFCGLYGQRHVACPSCHLTFDCEQGPAQGRWARCPSCCDEFEVLDAVHEQRPPFRLFAKLVLRTDNTKEYLGVSSHDIAAYQDCSRRLCTEVANGSIAVPLLALQHGHNTKQAMRYGFSHWRDFFNDRQLLALGMLQAAILKIGDSSTRDALSTLFSGVLEFNNLFTSYKGEGTGAVRHMFSHHILKPERVPIEANVWGTPKSSGSFSSLFRTRLLKAIDYREAPTEVNGTGTASGKVCSPPFSGKLHEWGSRLPPRSVALSCGDSAVTGLRDCSVDLVVTDPPFFDNVHYSELADFFQAWQYPCNGGSPASTRCDGEVQDSLASRFAQKLQGVLSECCRVLADEGLLVFTYHHSRDDGWTALAEAILGAGLTVVNSHPVKAEMSVATPKTQAKEPIQFDIIIVCRKNPATVRATAAEAITSANAKVRRLQTAGFRLSRNDRKVIYYGQLMTTLQTSPDANAFATIVDQQMEEDLLVTVPSQRELRLFPNV